VRRRIAIRNDRDGDGDDDDGDDDDPFSAIIPVPLSLRLYTGAFSSDRFKAIWDRVSGQTVVVVAGATVVHVSFVIII